MAKSPVYIAGVGYSYLNGASKDNVQKGATSAGTKALLDAGLTYNDVDQSFACFLGDELKIAKSTLESFGKTGAPVSEMDSYSGLFTASQTIGSGRSNCTMIIGFDTETNQGKNKGQAAVVGLVLVSELILTSHAYLKDSAVSMSGSNVTSTIHSRTSGSDPTKLATKAALKKALQQADLNAKDVYDISSQNAISKATQEVLKEVGIGRETGLTKQSQSFSGNTGLVELCNLVYQLRGWTGEKSSSGAKNFLQHRLLPDTSTYVSILGRADGNGTPEWKEVEHLRDGRERVGYNPAVKTKDISFEDWQAVKARDEFVPDKTGEKLGLPVKGGDRAALARL